MNLIETQADKKATSALAQAAYGQANLPGEAAAPTVLTSWPASRALRVGGQLAGHILEAEDCWDDDEDLLRILQN